MLKKIIILCIATLVSASAMAQFEQLSSDDGSMNLSPSGKSTSARDTTNNKEIPRGMTVWTVDRITGDNIPATPDTMSYMQMNRVFASGLYGQYNTTGNNGSPRLNRIFIDRESGDEFIFTNGYSQVMTPSDQFHFTNTYSPITNIVYNSCGNKTNGEDHLKATFAVNASKKLGFGFQFNYLYARGYYANQNLAHFNYNMWGSYHGDRYQAHILIGTYHQKQSENGGITNDEYITHPESFSDNFASNEIPTLLESNWNKNDNQHIFFTQRYSVGFNRKVPMTEQEIEAKKFAMASQKEKEERERREQSIKDGTYDPNNDNGISKNLTAGRPKNAKIAGNEPAKENTAADSTRISMTAEQAKDSIQNEKSKTEEEDMFMKDEYVPVTSFFHTLALDHYRRTYLAYQSPAGLYLNDYYALNTDSVSDMTKYTYMRNNIGISMLEGFNKWAKAGIKLFAAHELKHYALPLIDGKFETWNENSIIVGGEISKRQGKTLHFNALGEAYIAGANAGQIRINGGAELSFPLFGDTVSIDAKGMFHIVNPYTFYKRYQSRHFMWNVTDNFDKETRLRIEGNLTLPKFGSRLRIAVDNLTNYTYLATTYNIDEDYKQNSLDIMPRQASDVQVITAQLYQNFKLGILHWDNILTYQKSTNQSALPLPDFNVYSNLYLRFKIARVLDTDFGVDARYFTEYDAPEYSPQLQSFVIQENEAVKTKVGNYPICNVYANFQLKTCRFYVMMSHINYSGKGNCFLTPHHPINGRVLRIGLNWNFHN